jgi:hypothetical protein
MRGNVVTIIILVLAATAVTSKDKFRKKVTDPRSLNPTSHMPPHPEFDDTTFNALETYFKARGSALRARANELRLI